MKKLIGIDLGTTNSVISYLDSMGNPQIIYNEDGQNITPSIVSFISKDNAMIGTMAKKDLDNENRFETFKRNMGSEKKYPNSLEKDINPTLLSSLVLQKLFKIAEEKLGDISEVVVTVPANFTNQAREATLEAGKMAGLHIKHIINEPTAAALFSAYKSGEDLSGNYAFYDLGGGTFDVSIVKISGDDIEILSSEGVAHLGGMDFDKKLKELVIKKYKEQTGKDLDSFEYDDNKVEEDKKSLSKLPSLKISFGKGDERIKIHVKRQEFETAISSLVTQAEILSENAINQAGLDLKDIKEVFLVGGSTRIPFIKESVEKIFKRTPISRDNPDEVVCLGASIYCGYKTDKANLTVIQKSSMEKVNLQEISNHYFGTISAHQSNELEKPELQNSILIKKGSKIPCSKSEIFHTLIQGQTAVECKVTQSSHEEIDPNFVKIIWEGKLELPPDRPAGQEVRVTFSYDSNQIMKCSFLDIDSGKNQNVNLNMNKKNEDLESDIDKFMVS